MPEFDTWLARTIGEYAQEKVALCDQPGYEVTHVNMAKAITPQPHEDQGAGER